MRTRSESVGGNASDAQQGRPDEVGDALERQWNALGAHTERITSKGAHTGTSILSSPRKKGGHNAKSPRAASSGHPHRATPGEIVRERKLREDPMVLIHTPQLVQCKRCGSKIKLSLKSFYDPFHWQKHRERCLKKPEVVVQEMKEANQPTLRHKTSWPSEAKVVTTPKRRSTTPPLIPDDDDEDQSTVVSATKEESPTPDVADSEFARRAAVDLEATTCSQVTQSRRETVEEYLLRSQARSRSARELMSAEAYANWQNWNWSQLRTPTFTAPYHSSAYPPTSSRSSLGISNDSDDQAGAEGNLHKIDVSDDWCWSPPRYGFGFKESRVRGT